MTVNPRASEARDWQRLAVLGAVGAHLALTGSHAVAHVSIPVPNPDWQIAYALLVLLGLPVAGAGLAVRGAVGRGALLVFVGGVGGLIFEVLAHFVVHSPDHVASVESGRALFAGTAGLSVVGDALLVAAGGWVLWAHSQGRSRSAVTSSTR
ncbi:hypothetical protein [Halosimplex salinum]|uniref:hypothetical protein n=1 Tax=Halosimplex salinum TaxID=1710538 RepID=UPI000F4AE70A|nr:hypothetical protein [Halosimplex salinum]